MKKRNKLLRISALVVLAICVYAFIGSGCIVFKDETSVNNHLNSATFRISLTRVSYKEYVLDESTGLLTQREDDEKIDLIKDQNEIFRIENSVPACWYEATIEISNLGNIALDYGALIIWTNKGSATQKDKALASQIKITISGGNLSAPVEFMLDQCAKNRTSLGSILKGEEPETFTVKAEFIDSKDNNLAMDASILFDVQVFATQKTA